VLVSLIVEPIYFCHPRPGKLGHMDKEQLNAKSTKASPFSIFFTPPHPGRRGGPSEEPPPKHETSSSITSFISSIESGTPFLKHDLLTRSAGNIVVAPPQGLYPAIALIPTLGVLPEYDTVASHLVGFGPMFLASVGSVIAQITAVYYINIIGDEKETNPDGSAQQNTSAPLRLVCLAVFIMVQLSEIKAAIEFLDYVVCVPSVPSAHIPVLRERNVKLLTTRTVVKNDRGEEFIVEGFAGGGFTPFGRIWALIWCLTDGIVNSVVLIYGSMFVLYSGTNEDLILNAVALNFISKIDDTAYDFLITKMVKGWIAELPQVGLVVGATTGKHRVGRMRLVSQILGQWIQVLVLIVATLVCWTPGTLQ
jgi:hypothetical protein